MALAGGRLIVRDMTRMTCLNLAAAEESERIMMADNAEYRCDDAGGRASSTGVTAAKIGGAITVGGVDRGHGRRYLCAGAHRYVGRSQRRSSAAVPAGSGRAGEHSAGTDRVCRAVASSTRRCRNLTRWRSRRTDRSSWPAIERWCGSARMASCSGTIALEQAPTCLAVDDGRQGTSGTHLRGLWSTRVGVQ